jgi:hypothetical protein
VGAARLKTIVTESKQGPASSLAMNDIEKMRFASHAGVFSNKQQVRYAH